MRRTMPLQSRRAFSSVAIHASSCCRLHLSPSLSVSLSLSVSVSVSLVRSCRRRVAVSQTLLVLVGTFRGTRARKCICRRLILRTRSRRGGEWRAAPTHRCAASDHSPTHDPRNGTHVLRLWLSITTEYLCNTIYNIQNCTCLRAAFRRRSLCPTLPASASANFRISLYLCLRLLPPPRRIAYVSHRLFVALVDYSMACVAAMGTCLEWLSASKLKALTQ